MNFIVKMTYFTDNYRPIKQKKKKLFDNERIHYLRVFVINPKKVNELTDYINPFLKRL